MNLFLFSAAFLLFASSFWPSRALSPSPQDPLKLFLGRSSLSIDNNDAFNLAFVPLRPFLLSGSHDFRSWKDAISADSLAPGPSRDGSYHTLLLAADRTKRPDVLRGFRRYQGGWNITDSHYWASVGFTGAAPFVLASLWFLSFALLLAIHHGRKWRVYEKAKDSLHSRRICLILLIIFTCAAG